jgi:hypothetical protein
MYLPLEAINVCSAKSGQAGGSVSHGAAAFSDVPSTGMGEYQSTIEGGFTII